MSARGRLQPFTTGSNRPIAALQEEQLTIQNRTASCYSENKSPPFLQRWLHHYPSHWIFLYQTAALDWLQPLGQSERNPCSSPTSTANPICAEAP